MVSSEEIVERSLYMNLLATAIQAGVTLDPDDYLDSQGLPTPEGEARWKSDKDNISRYVYIFGVGNNQSRGPKEVPRIVLNLQGYYPGNIGMERYQIDDTVKSNPRVVETGYTSKDISIDVHLVGRTQQDIRLLHRIMYRSLPQQGYIKPYFNDKEEFFKGGLLPSENIYVEVGNHYDHQDNDHGLLEHVYTYNVADGVVDSYPTDIELVPIKDISCIINGSKLRVTSRPVFEQLDPYLYKSKYFYLNYAEGKRFMDKRFEWHIGACSSLSKGPLYARNFDYPYDDRVYFAIKTIADPDNGLFGTIGMAGGLTQLTKDFVHSGEWTDLYNYLPFFTLDGMNDHHVRASMNLVSGDKGITTGTEPIVEKRDTICTIMLVRYILDHFSTAYEAVHYIQDYVSVYSPANMNHEGHVMVNDTNNTYVLEFIDNAVEIVDITDRPWLTNFYITGTTINDDGTVSYPSEEGQYGISDFAQGLERWNIIANNYSNISDIASLKTIMSMIYYTNAYNLELNPIWKTDFTGDWTEQGFGILKVYDSREQFLPLMQLANSKYLERVRDGKTWQTVYSTIYDALSNKMYITTQEQDNEYELVL